MGTKYVATRERVKLRSGDVVKIAREMLGLTQAALAEKTGISPSHISEIEKSRLEIGRQRAIALSEALHIPAPYIMFPTPDFYQMKQVA